MNGAVACWLFFGLGLTCVARGLWPPRMTLAQSLAAYRSVTTPPRITAAAAGDKSPRGAFDRMERRLARALRRSTPSLVAQLVPVRSQADLTVAGVSAEQLVAEKLLTALAAALTVTVLSASMLLVADLPLVAPVWLACVFAAVGFLAPDQALRRRVRDRRHEMQDVIALFVSVVALSLSAGNGVQTALRHGVERGDGWAWRQLRAAITVARRTRETEWQALGRLGEELDIAELEELAARTRLAQNDGARIHDSLKSFAGTLHSRRLTRLEKRFHRNTLEMAAASCVIAAGFALLLGGAALGGITTN